jgi:hypothetical protein
MTREEPVSLLDRLQAAQNESYGGGANMPLSDLLART